MSCIQNGTIYHISLSVCSAAFNLLGSACEGSHISYSSGRVENAAAAHTEVRGVRKLIDLGIWQ